jgi:hypothetical protein
MSAHPTAGKSQIDCLMGAEIMTESCEQIQLNHVVEHLTRKYPSVPPATVAGIVHHIHTKFDGRPLRDFVPLLVERNANAELAKLAS